MKLVLRADAEGNVEFRRRFWTFRPKSLASRRRFWSTPISSRPAMLVASKLRNSYVARSSLDLADRAALRPLARLVSAVRKATGTCPLVLVGAAARDVLLVHAYGAEPQRATEDTDLALAVPDWNRFSARATPSSARGRSRPTVHRIAFGSGISASTSFPSAESSGVTGVLPGPRKATRS